MRRFIALAAATSVLALSTIVLAAEITTPPPDKNAAGAMPAATEAAPPGRISEVTATGKPIVLEVGKGLLIRLPRAAGTVFIANPEVADVVVKTPALIYLQAKTPGDTALYAVDPQDRVLMNAPVRVEHDLSRVRESMRAVAPGENVQVSSLDNSLVLSGNVSSAGRAERMRSLAAAIAGETKGSVINRLSVATPNQVNIRVKVAEIDRQVLKSLGVNWQKPAAGQAGSHVLDPISFNTTNPTVVGASTPAALGVTFGGTSWLTTATINALAQENLITTLAEPNLTATNGQPASFLAGGEFPVPIAQPAASGAAGTLTVEFKQFGVSLDVTPTIIDAQHLNLRIRSEVSQLSSNGAVSVPLSATSTVTIPALTERRAETTVELGSGQSYLLAGLLQNTDTQNISKVPALGDIPIIGQLFRSQQFQRNETELVIIVTPYLVKPTATMAKLATPTDGFVAPNDVQQIINEGEYRQTLPGPAKGPVGAGGQGLVGSVGFRLD
jgi:pilus assembly protein CpaC